MLRIFGCLLLFLSLAFNHIHAVHIHKAVKRGDLPAIELLVGKDPQSVHMKTERDSIPASEMCPTVSPERTNKKAARQDKEYGQVAK